RYALERHSDAARDFCKLGRKAYAARHHPHHAKDRLRAMTRLSSAIPCGLPPDEAAAAWLVRINEGPLPPEDQAEFDTWRVESTANVAAFTKAEAAWNLFNGTP